MLQSMGGQRIGHDLVIEQQWHEYSYHNNISFKSIYPNNLCTVSYVLSTVVHELSPVPLILLYHFYPWITSQINLGSLNGILRICSLAVLSPGDLVNWLALHSLLLAWSTLGIWILFAPQTVELAQPQPFATQQELALLLETLDLTLEVLCILTGLSLVSC